MNENITPSIHLYEEYGLHQKALLCAYLSFISYLNKEDMDEWAKEMNIRENKEYSVNYSSSKSLQFNVITSETHQFITLRGTDTYYGMFETIQDLKVSFNLLPIKAEYNVWFHRGYYKAGREVIKAILEMKILDNNKKTVICGHSMGAAIAKCITHIIDFKVDLFTFGSPQVSRNRVFENKNIRIYGHYINDHDVIPQFPSKIYNDRSINYILYDSGEFIVEEIKKSGLLIPFIELTKYSLKKHVKLFDNHAISKYVFRLHKIVKK